MLATGDTAAARRATIARAIAPVWEANHVWLIVVVTILFTAFPPAFAPLSIALHIPLALAQLIGIGIGIQAVSQSVADAICRGR